MRQVVCLSGQPWAETPTRTQQLINRLRDAEVLFFEPPAPRGSRLWKEPGRRLRPGVIVYTLPPVLTQDPADGFFFRRGWARSARFLQAKMEKHRFREPVLWCASPAGAEYLDTLAYRGVVYDCDRDWPEASERLESDLTAAADVVFAASPELARHLSPCNPNVTLLPNGCSYPMFAKDDLPRPAALDGITSPILGWAGTLWPDLDLSPLLRLALSRTDCTVVLAGRDAGCRQLHALLELPNVTYLGFVPPADLPDCLAAFDVCLSLVRRNRLHDDVIPSRIFEYLATGKPVVVMLRPDQVEHFPDVVYAAHSSAEFSLLCSRALEESGLWARERRREYGKAAAWSERAGEVNRILESIGLF